MGADIVFVDEVGFSFQESLATTWAPKGQTPFLRRVSQRRQLSTIVALTLSGRIYKRHFPHAIRGDDVLVTLPHFKQHIPGLIIVVWDRLSAHRDKSVQQYIADYPDIYQEWLAPYAPDLNPEEACHGNIKQHLRNATPETVLEMRKQVDRAFA